MCATLVDMRDRSRLGVCLGVAFLLLGPGCASSAEPEEEEAASEEALNQNGCVTADAPNDDAANLRKYADYRTRLRSEFITVSANDEPGTNLPAGKRQGSTLFWSDTTINLGAYLSMLATEYKLLAGRQPQNALTTARELLYALKALDRLDRTAESYFRPDGSSAETDLNGFFIRDDVTNESLAKFPLAGASAAESDTTTPFGGKPGYRSTEMSQDQVWHLLVGLALVTELVDFAGDLDGAQVDFRARAKAVTHRILSYMRAEDNWRTQNPIFGTDVLRGGDWDARRVFSYGFATAGNWITSHEDASQTTYPNLHNETSYAAKTPFRLARVAKKDNYNQRSLATVGDINYFIGIFDHGSTLWKLEHEVLSNKVYKYEQFPLIHVVLHGGATRLNRAIYGGLLNAAPASGPQNHGDGATSCAWAGVSRLVWPESNDSRDEWRFGEYNGVDYMLLHNLYQLVYNEPELAKLYGPF
jgi:hypothetical protein